MSHKMNQLMCKGSLLRRSALFPIALPPNKPKSYRTRSAPVGQLAAHRPHE